MKQNDKLYKTIIFILQIAKQEDIKDIDYTALVKYVYLLDCFYAEENNGKQYTDVEWKFLNFGPYCAEFQDIFNIHNKDSRIFLRSLNSKDPEKNNSRIGYSGWNTEYILKDFSSYLISKLKEKIKEFSGYNSKGLNSLLQYIYFHTTPMIEAKHKEILNFSHCYKLNYQTTIKPIQSPTMDTQTISEFSALISLKKKQKPLYDDLYDDLYEETLVNLKPIYQTSEYSKNINEHINFSGKANLKISGDDE